MELFTATVQVQVYADTHADAKWKAEAILDSAGNAPERFFVAETVSETNGDVRRYPHDDAEN